MHNNRPLTLKSGHNCSSWIATAPLGENREALLELLGTNRHCEIGTNPGWWTNWLAAAASPERVPFVILWTNEPIATVLARDLHPERGLTWDFNRQ